MSRSRPRCDVAFTVRQNEGIEVDYDGIELDRCPECEGIFVDGDERHEFAKPNEAFERPEPQEEVLQCDGCGRMVLKRTCIRRMDAYWCEACVVAGNHPGQEAALVGTKDMATAAAVALARGKMEQVATRQRAQSRQSLNRRRVGPRRGALQFAFFESLVNWLDEKFRR